MDRSPLKVGPPRRPWAAVPQAWLNAVNAGDVEQVAAMVTDDTVVVHGNGRCVRGRDEFRMDFLEGFKRFTTEQTASSTEVVFRGRWAFEISEVVSTLIPVGGGEPIHASSTAVVVLGRQQDGSWKVERVLGVPGMEVWRTKASKNWRSRS